MQPYCTNYRTLKAVRRLGIGALFYILTLTASEKGKK